jgi:hypothetical protein
VYPILKYKANRFDECDVMRYGVVGVVESMTQARFISAGAFAK